ncbi:hypothetical protein SAMN00808754_0968 [Thermanaeromonas toyohensis ToBE]|uniref:Uncharacterized protein n=1 Tax=Thermanaeromonas toyohensis ToBE TaxID=698762 RepID=A0A1W1VL35_9FIRM|nr:hypothetical protein [Thermanaeromonas toyohensis]SMB94099.1 hypothetical protein SAMN00808754_0968 [Thermanaeromonas toyohensis ToBE]
MLICWPSAFQELRSFPRDEELRGEPEPYGVKEVRSELLPERRQKLEKKPYLEVSTTSGFLLEAGPKEEVERIQLGQQQEPKGKPVETVRTTRIPDMGPDIREVRGSFQEYLGRALKGPGGAKASKPHVSEVRASSRQPHKNLDVEDIVEAWEAGETLESIAKRLGRGKGEIELILRLWRLRG